MGCSSTNEELEAKINKLIDKRNEIRKLKKRKIITKYFNRYL